MAFSEVEQGPEEGHRRLKEITRGYGGICGGAYIDNNMRYLLEKKLGRHAQSMPSCQFENIMQIFIEEIKVRNPAIIHYYFTGTRNCIAYFLRRFGPISSHASRIRSSEDW